MQTQIINTCEMIRERKAASLRNARATINAIAVRNIIQMQLEGLELVVSNSGWHVCFNK